MRKRRLPDWPRPLIPIGRGFLSQRGQFRIFERSNPVLSSGRGTLRRVPEYLSISTFAPAPEIHSLWGGFFVAQTPVPIFRAAEARAVHADHRIQSPRARPMLHPSGGFSLSAPTGTVLPLIETSGVPIGIWTRDVGIRVPRSTKWRLFRSVDRARAVGYGTSPSMELQSKFPTRHIFQIGFS
jgi:hypothetical protein